MIDSPRARFGGIAVLLGLLFVLAVWFGSLAPAPGMGAFPDEDALATGYDGYRGERVVVSGRVTATDPVVIEKRVGAGGRIRVTIVDPPVAVTEGTGLSVYGIARADGTIEAIDAVAYRRSGRRYAYSISLVAGLWVLGRIVRGWRVDRDGWGLAPRTTPLTVGDLVRTLVPEEGDADA